MRSARWRMSIWTRTGATDTGARRRERASAAASGRDPLGREGRRMISMPASPRGSGIISIASSIAAPISRSIGCAHGVCRASSTPRRCTTPRNASSASTISRHSAPPSARRSRRSKRSIGSTCSREGEDVIVRTSARSFLHNQVRSMVGSLAFVGDGKWTSGRSRRRARGARPRRLRAVAPPEGLIWSRVDY